MTYPALSRLQRCARSPDLSESRGGQVSRASRDRGIGKRCHDILALLLVPLSVVFAGLFVFLSPATAPAQFSTTITAKASEVSLMDLTGFKTQAEAAALLFRRTLESDLKRSGWFQMIASGRGEFTVLGSADREGDDLQVKCEVYNVASKERLLGKRYSLGADDAARLAHRVADDIVLALTGHPGMASSQLVLVGNRTGAKELYLCDADGGNLRQLTSDNCISLGPKWAQDGRRIVYNSDRSGFPDALTIDMASGKRTCIANYPGLNGSPALSPNGRRVALVLSKDGQPDLYVKDLSGGNLTRLTNDRYAEASPTWAPDGAQLAFVSDRSGHPQLFIMSQGGGEPRRVTSAGSENVDPDWGQNGFIAYASLSGRAFKICVLNPETGDTKTVSRDDASYEDPSWAPDGRHLACTRTSNYKSAVFVIDTMSAAAIGLTPDKGNWSAADWSPK
ncbi:MAG: PD40 domain-containing protein [Lentisphaerae bacterium]|nr:PD40 domain-containing protein [Lentisphaerota bacterium]